MTWPGVTRPAVTRLRTVLVAAALGAGLAPAATASADTVRVALVVGANRGAVAAQRLRYAERDAERFARVLSEVGGLKPDRLIVARGPSAADLARAFDRADALVRRLRARPDDRVVFIFYYSGHSDGLRLELGGSDFFSFAEVRRRLAESPADVRLAFVDSCRSGGITRDKGLAPGPSFDLTLSDGLDAGGSAFVTSSSAGEKAQESSEIGGSYFTHFLISALRGAGDADGNSRVTLQEAYQYTFAKTVAETARTVAGPQHPSYAYDLTGRGDLTLADLREAVATLTFPKGAGGTYLVVDAGRRELVAEVVKPADEARRLAVPVGDYVVGRRAGDAFLATRVSAARGSDAVIMDASLRPEPLVLASAKGPDLEWTNLVSAGYALVGGALGSFAPSSEIALGYRREILPYWHFAPRLALGLANVDDRGLQYRYRAAAVDAAVLRRFELLGLAAFAGAGAGGLWARQTLASGQEQGGFLFRYGATAALDVPLPASLVLNLAWDAGAAVLRLNDRFQQRLQLRASMGVGYAF